MRETMGKNEDAAEATAAASLSRLGSIWWRMFENIDNDYLEIFIVTSRAGGLEPSEGRSYGVGKSTMAIWMAYRAHAYARKYLKIVGDEIVDLATPDERIRIMLDIIDNYLVWTLDDLLYKLHKTSRVIPAVIWDDVQYDCPAYHTVPPELRRKIEWLTRSRQKVSNIILTAPSIGEIAKILRIMINVEIIVPRRGVYEIQFLTKRRNFYDPTEDVQRMWYEGTGFFDPLPKEVDDYYKRKREEALDISLKTLTKPREI